MMNHLLSGQTSVGQLVANSPARTALLLASLTSATALVANPQAPRQIQLAPHNAQIDAEFTHIGAVRELSDGRVIATDLREGRIVVVDFRSGAVTSLSRRGDGPGEFRRMSQLLPLGGDSTIHAAASGWIVFEGTRVATTWPAEQVPIGSAASSERILGFDQSGHVVRSEFSRRDYLLNGLTNTKYFVRYARNGGEADWIGAHRMHGAPAGLLLSSAPCTAPQRNVPFFRIPDRTRDGPTTRNGPSDGLQPSRHL